MRPCTASKTPAIKHPQGEMAGDKKAETVNLQNENDINNLSGDVKSQRALHQ